MPAVRRMLFALPAMLIAPAIALAAVPGEVIAAHNDANGWYVVMSAGNGSNFAQLTCGGDLTHGGSPRYFLTSAVGTIKLGDGYPNNELVASDEDCVQTLTLTDARNMRFSDTPRWSPDGLRVAVHAHVFSNPGMTEDPALAGMYLADVQRDTVTGRPTGLTNLRLVVQGGTDVLSWSGDSRRIAYVAAVPDGSGGWQGDVFVYDLESDASANVTNTPGFKEDHPAFSPADERIAFTRLVAIRGGYRYDIFTIPASGGVATQVTSKGTTGAPQNRAPCFSPDGLNLSFASGPSATGRYDIYRINSNGAGKATNLTGRRSGSFFYNLWRR